MQVQPKGRTSRISMFKSMSFSGYTSAACSCTTEFTEDWLHMELSDALERYRLVTHCSGSLKQAEVFAGKLLYCWAPRGVLTTRQKHHVRQFRLYED